MSEVHQSVFTTTTNNWKKVMDNYHSYDLMDSSFHDNTPLLVTKYMSDIEPNTTRFSHKIYKKTKKNLRNEIVLGNELKLSADIGNGRKPIYAQFFIHPEQMKRYMYAKMIFHFIRRTSGFDKEKYQHGYHQWTKNNSDVTDKEKKAVSYCIPAIHEPARIIQRHFLL
jgi:hypothetical protein